jgi:hypothetical protein
MPSLATGGAHTGTADHNEHRKRGSKYEIYDVEGHLDGDGKPQLSGDDEEDSGIV